MSIELRDYQFDMYQEGRELVRAGARTIVFQASTGAGKTALAAYILAQAIAKGSHVHFWVHRRELVRQSLLAMDRAGVRCGVIRAGYPINDAPAQVVMIPSLPRRLNKIRKPDLIVIDEIHHAASKTLSTLIEAFPNAVILSLTATPWRLDGRGLRPWFEKMVLGPPMSWLIENGWLAPYRMFCPSQLDLSDVHITAGDYNRGELSAAMGKTTVVGDAVAHYKKYVPGKRGLVFAWSIEASKEIVARFNAAGIPAAHVDGETEDRTRDRAIDRFTSGELKILSNVDLFGEGVDVPALDAVFDLTPTRSLTRYLQRCGRALRPSEGKAAAFLFDHSHNSSRHGLPDEDREWSLDGVKRKKKSLNPPSLVRCCPVCQEVSSLRVRVCPCGQLLVQTRELEHDEHAELTEVDPGVLRRGHEMTAKEEREYQYLVKMGRRKRYPYPEKWATHVIQGRARKKIVSALAQAGIVYPKETVDPWAF